MEEKTTAATINNEEKAMNDLTERLRNETDGSRFEAAKRIEMLEEALTSAIAFIDQYVDVEDGPDGIPAPNYAMALNTFLNEVLEGKDV